VSQRVKNTIRYDSGSFTWTEMMTTWFAHVTTKKYKEDNKTK